jgi:hypothetical protein
MSVPSRWILEVRVIAPGVEAVQNGMSALPLKADLLTASGYWTVVQLAPTV